MIRPAHYAGSFYKRNADKLVESIEESFMSSLGPQALPSEESKIDETIPFLLVPHAGYMYSGPVAAWSYLELSKYKQPGTIIIFGPNHTGMGAEIGVPDKVEAWETPLGNVQINNELIDKIVESSGKISRNDNSHAREHSIEVQLPFLQYVMQEKFQFVPISLLNQSLDSSIMLGEVISKACSEEDVIVIASSDFTHFMTHEEATKQDKQVLDAIEKMETKEMYDIKYRLNVSMCGHGPIAATMEAAKKMGRTKAEILKYATSGDASGDKRQVVGYGAAKFYAEK
ncbi:MAG: AmmeMemoRadiSam system protein B [Candidatus Heimdallarchaeota archaeon]|nr:AmmeMemoRadiSam system protein B [Candidatus Heimdallarchaeota archaeon]MCK4954364.1 AmmeMemoRadiSam system protein B [Candidatus Heimdallarchaeota archaeon]